MSFSLILLMAYTPGRLILLVSERFLGIDFLLLLPGVALIQPSSRAMVEEDEEGEPEYA